VIETTGKNKKPVLYWERYVNIKSSLILSTALASSFFATGAYSEEARAVVKAEPQALEEIMVNATRRTTNLQSTPVAVSAVDSVMIQEAAPHDLGDLAAFVPNFSAAKITGFNAASFAMRGVGQNNIIVYFESPVAVLVDDFVMPSVQTQLLDTFDVEQVEVLRGPQGTLFGKNTTGGAVVVRTTKPDLENFGGKVRASYGSYNDYRLNAALNIPLVKDKLALRLVGGYEKGDGYMRNGAAYGPIGDFASPHTEWNGISGHGDGARVGGPKVFNGRAKLLFKPVENIKALFQYEIMRDRSAAPASVNTTPNDPARFAFAALGLAGGAGDPINIAGVSNRSGLMIDVQDGHRINVDGLYLNVDADFDAGTLTSVTGYRNQRSSLANTYPGTAPVAANGDIMSLFDANRSDAHRTFQQELRFASKFNGPVNFVAGGFYQNDKAEFCQDQILGFLDLLGVAGPSGGWNNNPFVVCNNQRAHSVAAYGEANYKATEKLTLTAGFRYNWEKKTWNGRQQVFAGQLDGAPTWQSVGGLLNFADFTKYPSGVVTDSHSWKNPSWRLSLGYQATPDIYTYFTYSRGFKSGAYNDQIGSFAPFGTNLAAFKAAAAPTNPEKADSFEIGVKTESFEHRLRINLTGFYVQYKDVQKQLVVPVTTNGVTSEVTTFFNAAKMEVKGIEGELTALPMDGLTLRAVLGIQDGKYKSYITPEPAGYNLATADIDRAPKLQWTLDANYEMPLNSFGKVAFNGNVSYTGKNLFTQSITSPLDNTYLDAQTLVNGSVTLTDASDSYYIRFLGKNLTNKRYKTAEQVVAGLWVFALYGPPRTFAAEIGAKF
jgi:iron complex outermembrane receptor protein